MSLAVAVFLNWKFSAENGELDLSGVLNSNSNLGDAQYVAAPGTTGTKVESDFFAKSRQDRQKARADAMAALKETADDVKASTEAKAAATAQMNRIAKDIETESTLETLIKAKGFAECVAVINEENISIIVKTKPEGLLPSETMQIQDIVTTGTKFTTEKINIIEVK